ncbi:ribonuclease H-like domain-containing protein [Tanacetum coccineum]|uniref:Ribonuclease H-like domain-containing protein n=1 Tax=Tanacetum coccineum TaxID=301880 RepID=A0ABQ4ZWB3_9ASTR
MERELGEGYSFIKKKCFVCGSLSHLIRDCDFYEKKIAREAELKTQRVFNTGKRVAKPVWNNANSVNHANQFVSRLVELNTGRANVNSVRPNVNTGRATVNSVRQNVNSVRSNVNTGSFNINTVKAKQPIPTSNSNSFSHVRPQGHWGTAVKTSAGYNWRRTRPNSNYNSGSNFIRTDHPLKNMEDRGIFDSGCSGNEMMERELGEGYSFIKKKCFVCGSLSHLIKDCDYYEKKMAREAELKKQRVFNTGNGVAKPVWNIANRVNHANHFVPRPVQLNVVRSNVNTGRENVNSVKSNVNSIRTNVNTGRSKQSVLTNNTNSFSPVRPQVNKFNQISHFSKSHSPVRRPIVRNIARMTYSHAVNRNWGTAVKTPAGYNWRRTRPNSNYNSGSNFVRTDHPLKNMEDRGIFDSGCSGHMTGNKDHLDDFEECKGGFVTFRGSKGYITGKGRIRVGNLDFVSVSFVKELRHFNLFSISQICDKHHKVLFTETECLVVSPDFKMPDENQILLKVPRQHNMYSLDMKTPSLTKDYACLIAKTTSDESKL